MDILANKRCENFIAGDPNARGTARESQPNNSAKAQFGRDTCEKNNKPINLVFSLYGKSINSDNYPQTAKGHYLEN